MWIVTDEGRAINSAFIESMQVEPRGQSFALVAQLHEVGAHARDVLQKTCTQPRDTPSHIRLATCPTHKHASEKLQLVLRAFDNNLTVCRMDRGQEPALEMTDIEEALLLR